MTFEVTPELLLRLLELIVLTLTAMVISLQLGSNFYQKLDEEANSEVEDYMPFEMSFVAFFLIGISTFVILLYLGYLAITGIGVSLTLIPILLILGTLSFGILLYVIAITSIGQDMVDTMFSRD